MGAAALEAAVVAGLSLGPVGTVVALNVPGARDVAQRAYTAAQQLATDAPKTLAPTADGRLEILRTLEQQAGQTKP